MKRIFFTMLIALVCFPTFADDTKLRVAVFDATSSGTSIDEGTKVAIREIISSTIVNAGNYDIVERSLLEKVMQEQSFSNSGTVDDNDATEIGKLAGANKVILSVVTLTGGRNMLSVKIIDVKTASVERQKVKVVASGELLNVIEPLTLSLVDASADNDDETIVIPNQTNRVEGKHTKLLREGTGIPLQASERVKAANVKKGQKIHFRVSSDVIVDNVTVIPVGTTVDGIVYERKKSAWFGTKGRLGIDIKEIIMPNGEVVPLRNGNIYITGKNRTALSVVVFFFTCLPLPCGTKAELPSGFNIVTTVASNVTVKVP